MTETMIKTTGVELDRSGFRAPLGQFVALLRGGMVAASTDKSVPALCAVRLEWGQDRANTVRVVATDRYRLVAGDYLLPSDERFGAAGAGDVSLSLSDVKALVKALPRVTNANVNELVSFMVSSGRVVHVEWSSGAQFLTPVESEFPRYRSLVPAPFGTKVLDPGLPDGAFACSGAYLSSIGDIPVARNTPWRMSFAGPERPMVAMNGDSKSGEIEWLFLLMPVRLTR